jgi:Mg2+ and Co2+ transporters
MLTILRDRVRGPEISPPPPELLAEAIWIDALDPTAEEKAAIESATGLYVSTQAELSEIESSSRFFEEDGAIHLSLPVIAESKGAHCITAPMGFVLTQERLITIRFAASPPVDSVAQRLSKPSTRGYATKPASSAVFLLLLEALVEVMADRLENLRAELDGLSNRIFRQQMPGRGPGQSADDLHRALQIMGIVNDEVSRIRDSLLVFGRVMPYVTESTSEWFPKELKPRLKTLRQDVASLSDYDAHLTIKVQFLLDAVLGFISIAQANIIKVMTVVGVVGVPPTLIASIYGMNFTHMPELHWAWGYPAALLLILVSAVGPILWFRHRGWL